MLRRNRWTQQVLISKLPKNLAPRRDSIYDTGPEVRRLSTVEDLTFFGPLWHGESLENSKACLNSQLLLTVFLLINASQFCLWQLCDSNRNLTDKKSFRCMSWIPCFNIDQHGCAGTMHLCNEGWCYCLVSPRFQRWETCPMSWRSPGSTWQISMSLFFDSEFTRHKEFVWWNLASSFWNL